MILFYKTQRVTTNQKSLFSVIFVLAFCALLLAFTSCGLTSQAPTEDACVENCPTDPGSDDGAEIPEPDSPSADEESALGKGDEIGLVRWTYYWIEFESSYTGEKDTVIYFSDKSTVLARSGFVSAVKIEGTGYLDDGKNTMINLDADCEWIVGPDKDCFFVVDKNEKPYGAGSGDHALRPWRTIAADVGFNADFNYDTTFYIEELDGAKLPEVDPAVFDPATEGFEWDTDCGCYVHDGCVTIEDTGVHGVHFDFFALTRANYKSITNFVPEIKIDDHYFVHAYKNSPRCSK